MENITITLPPDTWEEVLQAIKKCANAAEFDSSENYQRWSRLFHYVNVQRMVAQSPRRTMNNYQKYELPKRQAEQIIVKQSKINHDETDKYDNQPTFARLR